MSSGPKKNKLIGNSLNISDISNQLNAVNYNPIDLR